jgi:hypothetical protein
VSGRISSPSSDPVSEITCDASVGGGAGGTSTMGAWIFSMDAIGIPSSMGHSLSSKVRVLLLALVTR